MKSSKPSQPHRKPTQRGDRSRQRLGLVLAAGVVGMSAIIWATMSNRPPVWPVPQAPSPSRVSNAALHQPLTNQLAPREAQNGAVMDHEAPIEDPSETGKLQNTANELLAAGKLKEAIQYYEKAARESPDDEEAHFSLGFANARAGRIPEAITAYERALEIFPDHAEAHNNLGNLLVRQRKFDEAMGHFSAILQLNPENASAINNVGRCLADQGKLKEAITQFSEAVRLKPDYAEARCNLGMALLHFGRTMEASVQFNEALRVAPGFPPALAGLKRLQGVKP